MNIQVKKQATVAELTIQPGQYLVTANAESSQIILTGAGQDIAIPATRRPTKKPAKVTSVVFYSMGGSMWTLSVTVPNRGEYVAFLKLE